jgi:phage regulator Rha-like protein
MQRFPVRLAVSAEQDVTERYHVMKFLDTDAASVSLSKWQEPRMTRVVEAGVEAKEVVDFPEALTQELDAAKREQGLAELNKNEWVLQDAQGARVYHGKRLGAAGTFAVLVKKGNEFTLAPVQEWFQFEKKSSARAMNIDEAEAHLQELSRKSVQQATLMNRRIATDKLAAEAAVVDVKRSIVDRDAGMETERDVRGERPENDVGDDMMENALFEWSDDDEAAEVMLLATDEAKNLKELKAEDGAEEMENPLAKRMLTQEEKLEKRLAQLNAEYEEIERQERKKETEAAEGKRGRGEGEDAEEVGQKKRKKEPVVIRPLTDAELIEVLRSDPMVTLAKLIDIFKNSIAGDLGKKTKFMKMVARIAVTKKVDGQSVLRIREAK